MTPNIISLITLITFQGNIAQNHAFSILGAWESGGFKLLMLRNPWGLGEWYAARNDG